MKGCAEFPKAPSLVEPHPQIILCHIQDTRWAGSYSSAEKQLVHSTAPVDWANKRNDLLNDFNAISIHLGLFYVLWDQRITAIVRLSTGPSQIRIIFKHVLEPLRENPNLGYLFLSGFLKLENGILNGTCHSCQSDKVYCTAPKDPEL